MHGHWSIITELICFDWAANPRTYSVQTSYKLNLPSNLTIHSSNIKLVETIGQGEGMFV